VIVGHIILISAQVNTRRGVPMLEAIVFGGLPKCSAPRPPWSPVSGQLEQLLRAAADPP
jgi:hypothetical protein